MSDKCKTHDAHECVECDLRAELARAKQVNEVAMDGWGRAKERLAECAIAINPRHGCTCLDPEIHSQLAEGREIDPSKCAPTPLVLSEAEREAIEWGKESEIAVKNSNDVGDEKMGAILYRLVRRLLSEKHEGK